MRSLFKQMMDYCTYCPKMCRFSCPVSEATKSETFTPWGKMESGRWILDKSVTLSKENLLPAYQCTNCLHCQIYCEHGNDVPQALTEIRNIAVDNYAAPPEVYQVKKNFIKYGNPYGETPKPAHSREKGREEVPGKKETLFFISCHTLKHFPDRINVYRELFDKLNISGVAFARERFSCCGEPLRALGLAKEYQDVAEIQYHHLKKFKNIVVEEAECCFSIKERMAEQGLPLQGQVMHYFEFLYPFLEHSNYRTVGKMRSRLTFHDPSYLSRYLHLSDLPRKILSLVTGFSPLELSMNHEDSISSGVEGGYELLFPEVSQQIAKRTIDEVRARGIKKLITACPKSEVLFRKLARDFEVQDMTEFLNEHILRS